jgi:hypothetical protein
VQHVQDVAPLLTATQPITHRCITSKATEAYGSNALDQNRTSEKNGACKRLLHALKATNKLRRGKGERLPLEAWSKLESKKSTLKEHTQHRSNTEAKCRL